MSKVQHSSKTAPKTISVYLRVRPPVPLEKGHTFNNIKYDAKDNQVISVTRKSGSENITKKYNFNRVFQPDSSQKEVYDALAKNAVDASFQGEHGVLFVYGQTGSGKTYTISNNDPKNLGVLQQAMTEIWTRISADNDNDYTCSVSYIQLYNEILTDLLDEKKGQVRIQIGPEGRGDVDLVSQATGLPIERAVQDYKSTMAFFELGMSRKEMQSTSMNLTSSRSHTVFTFNIKKSSKPRAVTAESGAKEDAAGGGVYIALEGRLVLCDLAGSERVSKTHAEGKTLDEATHINSSLLVLGKVVAALTEPSQHAPFRESKLTRLLQYSLLGNGNTSIMVNISPSDNNTEESLSAILFGQRAIQIKQDTKRHEVLDYKALYLQLMAELDAKNDNMLKGVLDEEKASYEDRINQLLEQISVLTLENEALKLENVNLRSAIPAEQIAHLADAPPDNDVLKFVASVGTSTGGGSGSGGGGGMSNIGKINNANMGGISGNAWVTVISRLKVILEDRELKIREVNDEKRSLQERCAEEEQRCIKLAQKMRTLGLHYKIERTYFMKRQAELEAETASLKGTDYLNATANMIGSPVGSGADSNMDVSSPRTQAALSSDSSVDGASSEELEKAMALIRALRAERVELVLYQNKAIKAIKMLASDKDVIAQQLYKLKRCTKDIRAQMQ